VVKKITKKYLTITVALAFCLIVVPLISSVQAATVQQITGKLSGADFLVRIPSNWNGDLIVCCRGYSPALSGVDLSYYANGFNSMINMGYAFAISNFGVGGWCIEEGIARTRELTEWYKQTYPATTRVYLVGISMGGTIALELGARYPGLYAGVLDVSGTKDASARYYLHSYYAGISDDNALGAALVANGGINPPYPLTSIAGFRGYCQFSFTDVVNVCSGTPSQAPLAYQRISPIASALNIAIPTMTVHGTNDGLVPYNQSVDFMNTVAASGHADLYRLYLVAGGQHVNSPVLAQMGVRLFQLIAWVENGTLPPPTDFVPQGTYKNWTVMLMNNRIYLYPPANSTRLPSIVSIGAWDSEYYGRLGWTAVDAAKSYINNS
jgi:pimeloyl-ACP methyl ester carboxylesterase